MNFENQKFKGTECLKIDPNFKEIDIVRTEAFGEVKNPQLGVKCCIVMGGLFVNYFPKIA